MPTLKIHLYMNSIIYDFYDCIAINATATNNIVSCLRIVKFREPKVLFAHVDKR